MNLVKECSAMYVTLFRVSSRIFQNQNLTSSLRVVRKLPLSSFENGLIAWCNLLKPKSKDKFGYIAMILLLRSLHHGTRVVSCFSLSIRETSACMGCTTIISYYRPAKESKV